jgi:murein DD-endopeptidase MepM/ murein hydrolase activator NlpD
MRRIGWGFVMAVCVLVASTSPVVAQDSPAEDAADLPMCEPVTLEDLFPELYGPEVPDEEVGDESPAEDPTGEDPPPTEEPPGDDPPPAEEPPAEEPPGDDPPPAEEPSADEEPPAEQEPLPEEPTCTPFVYEFTYPVAGKSVAVSSFGADRSDHQHAGNDIAAAALTPVVAADDGRVSWIASTCCALAIRHADNWTTWYIHLNNDTFGTDDGLGWGIAPGLTVGSKVEAGQVIGWVGDSGNAEDSVPHLHFELRTPDNVAVDPAASLAEARSDAVVEQFAGPFADDDGSPYAEAISTLTSIGLLEGCGDDPAAFCPYKPVSGLEVARLVERITDLDITNVRLARVPEGPWQDTFTGRTGFLRGPRHFSSCAVDSFCSHRPITFSDLEELAWLLPVLRTGQLDTLMTVEDLAGSLWTQINRETPLAYCRAPLSGYVTNGELAELIARALGMVGPPPCDQIE